MEAGNLILKLAREAQSRLDAQFKAGNPSPGSPLDQAGLRDGYQIVADYISHGEFGVAFEHLLYMIEEPGLELSEPERGDIIRIARLLELPPPLA